MNHSLVTEPGVVTASVAILTKNPGALFRKVLESVLRQKTPWGYEVIVIDSGSADGTQEYVRRFQGIRLVEIPPGQFGHGKTRNLAVSLAAGKYVAMLTHDAMPVCDSWLARLVEPLVASPDVAGSFGRHVAYPYASLCTKRDIDMHFDGFRSWPAVMGIEDHHRYAVDVGYRQMLHFFSDNNACLRRSVWLDIPYEDVDFAEDQVWAKSVLEAGYKRAYVDDAAVFHSHDYPARDVFRRSFDESRALKRLFGYELSRGVLDGLRQVLACSIRDIAYIREKKVSAGSCDSSVRVPLLHLAKQAGYLAGRYDGRCADLVFRVCSLDDSRRRA